MWRKVIVLSGLAVLLVRGPANATVDDPYNLTGPSWQEFTPGNPFVIVRKADGTFWKKAPAGSVAWTLVAPPPGGGSFSGPIAATVGPAGGSWNVYLARGAHVPSGPVTLLQASEIGVNSGAGGGGGGSGSFGGWSDFDSHPLTSQVAFARIPSGQWMMVARFNDNLPYRAGVQADGTWSNWQPLLSTPITAAPGIAMTPSRADIVALQAGGKIELTSCVFSLPWCFTVWNEIPGGGVGISQPTAVWVDKTANDGPWLVVAVVGTDHAAYTNTFDNQTGRWSGWDWRGGWCDSPVAAHAPPTPGAEPVLTTLGSDGAVYVNPSGWGWNYLGQP
jgi:hypothetical protein